MDEQRNMEIATRALAALVAGEVEPLKEHPGYWQARRYFPAFFAPFAGLAMEVVDQFADGERVATRFRLGGVHAAEFCGVAATNRRIEFDAFSIDVVRDGLVVEHNATADLIAILAQFGVVTPRPLPE